jgi:hypothetical protein
MFLTPFKTSVSSSVSIIPKDHLNSETENHIYEVRYEGKTSKGSVTYRRIKLKGQQKPITQDILVLEKCDMNEIIDEINSNTPLKEQDLYSLQLEIRGHSRFVILHSNLY